MLVFQKLLRVVGLGPLPLTPATEKRLDALFSAQDRPSAKKILLWLPSSCSKYPAEAERIRFALLRLSNGSVGELENWMDVLRNDFRDVLLAAGFAEDVRAHESWFPKGPGLEGRPPLAERAAAVADDLSRLKDARDESRKRFEES